MAINRWSVNRVQNSFEQLYTVAMVCTDRSPPGTCL